MASNIEALIWSIYKMKGKLPQTKDYDTLYDVAEDEFKDTILKIKKSIPKKKYLKKHNNNMTDAILDILGVYNETKIKKQSYDDRHRQKILELRNIEDNRKQPEK